MAKIYLDANESFTVGSSSSSTTLAGKTGGSEKVIVVGTQTVFVDSSIERVELSGAASAYTYAITGNQVTVTSVATAATVAILTVPEGAAGQTIAFTDGSAALKITGLNAATLGGTAVPTTAAAVVPTLNTADKSTAGSIVSAAGQTFALTTDAETKVLTAGSDTVDGSLSGSLGDGDVITDASTTDNDVLNATINSLARPTIYNVETINLTETFAFDTGFDALNVSGAKKITIGSTYGTQEHIANLDGSKVASVEAGNTILDFALNDLSNNPVINQNKVTTLTLDGATAENDAATVNLSGTDLDVEVGASTLKTLNLKTSGTASTVTLDAVLSGVGSSVAVSGDANVTLKAPAGDLDATTLQAGVTKAMTGTAKLTVELTSIGADTNLTKVAPDNFVVSATAMGTSNVTFAAGTTNLTLTANAVTGTGGFVATGTGTTDVLNLTETKANTNLRTSGYETVNLTNSTGSALTITQLGVNSNTNLVLNGTSNVSIATTTTDGFKSVNASGLTGTAALSLIAGADTANGSVTGTANNDTVNFTSATGKYTINTGAGNDFVTGSAQDDTIDAGAGNDTINTGDGYNYVIAGDGDDSITLGTDDDTVLTGSGNNRVSMVATTWSTGDFLQGGAGTDTLSLSGVGPASIAFSASNAAKFTGFEKIELTEATTAAGTTITLADANVAAGTAFTFDATQANTAEIIFNASADTDSTFTINVVSASNLAATSSGTAITGGALNDVINFTAATTDSLASIKGGKGADVVTLTGDTGSDAVTTYVEAKGDSGIVTAVTNTFSVAAFDILNGFKTGDQLSLPNTSLLFDSILVSSVKTAPVTLGDNKIYQFTGKFDAASKMFTLDGTSTDTVIVYDSVSTVASTQFEVVVLVGYGTDTTITSVPGSSIDTGVLTLV